MWDSAQLGNTADDYRAYLDAYPNGVYGAMAKARVLRLSGAVPVANAASAAANAALPAAVPNDIPKGTVSPAALKAEVGTMQTEKALNLDQKGRREIQQRLKVMDFTPGDTSGNLGPKSRQAIGDWQKRHEIQPTTWLTALQRTALLEESETAWKRFANAQPMVPTRALAPSRPQRVSPGIAAAQAQRRQQQPRAPGPPAPRESGMGSVGAFIGGAIVGGALGGLLRR